MVEQKRGQNHDRRAHARRRCRNQPPCCHLLRRIRTTRSPGSFSLFRVVGQPEAGAPGSRGGTDSIISIAVNTGGGADAVRARPTIPHGGAIVLAAATPRRDTGSSIPTSPSRPPPRGRGALAGNAGVPPATGRVAMVWPRQTHPVQHQAAQPPRPPQLPSRPLQRPRRRSQ